MLLRIWIIRDIVYIPLRDFFKFELCMFCEKDDVAS